MEEGRISRYFSQGGFALGAELELFDENSNDLIGIVLPLSRIRPPLLYRGRSGTWWFVGVSIWSTWVGI